MYSSAFCINAPLAPNVNAMSLLRIANNLSPAFISSVRIKDGVSRTPLSFRESQPKIYFPPLLICGMLAFLQCFFRYADCTARVNTNNGMRIMFGKSFQFFQIRLYGMRQPFSHHSKHFRCFDSYSLSLIRYQRIK